ncbi:hypothetical protein D4764_02G0001780 [Takifugu flavidus]|uniref:Uncharacterized protein n=1 Tax=Takifugu flavidus TaxID=433684 RepID=A0A5C6NNA3_9TELE|nr:hypothetical protein D4764_02G0001780 [Takifugu flavidus]
MPPGHPKSLRGAVDGSANSDFWQIPRQSFQWLVENDVGYIKYIVDRHVKEKQRPERGPINDEWIKDYLQFFPQVSCHLEMCVDRAIYGQAAAEKAKRPGKQSRPASAHKSVRRTAPSSTARSPSEPHIEDKHGKMKWRKVLKDDRMWFQTYCPNSKMSSSPGLEGQTFDTFADFQRAVDILLGALFQGYHDQTTVACLLIRRSVSGSIHPSPVTPPRYLDSSA